MEKKETVAEKKWAKTFPPYIDAYQVTWEETDYVTFEEFCQWLEYVKWDWGDASIGIQMLTDREFLSVDGERFTFAIGTWGDEKYALVGNDEEDTEVVKFEWDGKYNVT